MLFGTSGLMVLLRILCVLILCCCSAGDTVFPVYLYDLFSCIKLEYFVR